MAEFHLTIEEIKRIIAEKNLGSKSTEKRELSEEEILLEIEARKQAMRGRIDNIVGRVRRICDSRPHGHAFIGGDFYMVDGRRVNESELIAQARENCDKERREFEEYKNGMLEKLNALRP